MSLLLLGAGGAGLFSPASLPGFVSEFNVSRALATGNLWQNTAKTVPAVANNDPVRVLVDPLTGIEYTAPSDAARGLLKISGGYSWIQTDGVDDGYSTTNSTIATRVQLGLGHAIGIRFFTTSAFAGFGDVLFTVGEVVGPPFQTLNCRGKNASDCEVLIVRSSTEYAASNTNPSLNVGQTYTNTFDGSNLVLRRNGVDGANTVVPGSGALNAPSTATSVGDGFAYPNRGFPGGIAGVVFLAGSQPSVSTVQQMENYLASLYS